MKGLVPLEGLEPTTPSFEVEGVRIVRVGFTIGCALRSLGLAVKLHPLNEEKIR